jgi:hypothetical protein
LANASLRACRFTHAELELGAPGWKASLRPDAISALPDGPDNRFRE